MAGKFALIVGNSRYDDTSLSRLKAPDVDVRALEEVLRAPDVGRFDEVNTLLDENCAAVRKAIARFFDHRQHDDLLLLYFSGHGVKDEQGHLYLALRDTETALLAGTAIETAFISGRMDRSYSRRQVLMLDCCHSGAFARGAKAANGVSVGTAEAFEGAGGIGRVVMTATDATQYAWEGDQIIGDAESSLFTHFIIDGLKSGAADRDGDGQITVDELYDYVREHVMDATPRQTPYKWTYRQQGDIVLARNPFAKRSALPAEIEEAITSKLPSLRLEAIKNLESLLHGHHVERSRAALAALKELSLDDSRRVASAAVEALRGHEERPEIDRADVDRAEIDRSVDVEAARHEAGAVDDRVDSLGSDIFLSYAREDRAAASALAGTLTERGWRVWWDRKIKPGEAFDVMIERELCTCKCAVVLWSANSVNATWVRNEARRASRRGVLIPILIDNVEIPLEFENLQAADLTSWQPPADHPELEALCERITALSPAAAERERVRKRKEEERREREVAEQRAREAEEARRVEAQRAEVERVERERAAAEHRERERLEAERVERERVEAARHAEAARVERERLEAARRQEAERIESERVAREQAEAAAAAAAAETARLREAVLREAVLREAVLKEAPAVAPEPASAIDPAPAAAVAPALPLPVNEPRPAASWSPLRVAATVAFVLMTIAAAKFAGLWPTTRAPERPRQQIQNDDARRPAVLPAAPVTPGSQPLSAENRRSPEPQPATRTQVDAAPPATASAASASPAAAAPPPATAPAPAPGPAKPATTATPPGAADDSTARARMQQRLRDAETAAERAKQDALEVEANVRSEQVFGQGERKQREAATLRRAGKDEAAAQALIVAAERFSKAGTEARLIAEDEEQERLKREASQRGRGQTPVLSSPPAPQKPAPLNIEVEKEAVIQTLRRYERACSSMDVAAVRGVYPDVSGESLKQMTEARSFTATIKSIDDIKFYTFSETRRQAVALVTIDYNVVTKSGQQSRDQRTQSITLEKQRGTWVITDVR